MKAKILCSSLAVALFLTAAVAKSGDPKKDIDDLRSKYAELFNQKQADQLATLYTEDAVIVTAGTATIQGRKNIHDYLSGAFSQGAGNLNIQSEGTQVGGNLAYDWGKFTDSTTTSGRYLVVLKKVGGKWLLAAESTFSDSPPTNK